MLPREGVYRYPLALVLGLAVPLIEHRVALVFIAHIAEVVRCLVRGRCFRSHKDRHIAADAGDRHRGVGVRHLRGIAGIHRCADNDRACASRVCSLSLVEVQILLALSAVHVPCDRIAVVAGRHRHGQVRRDVADGNNAGSYTGDRCAIRAGRSEALTQLQHSVLIRSNILATRCGNNAALVVLLAGPVDCMGIVLQRHRNGLVFLDAAQGEGLPAVRHIGIHVTLAARQRSRVAGNIGDNLLIARCVGDGGVS